ncbi:response regulator transcription factor [Nocardia niigatensis]
MSQKLADVRILVADDQVDVARTLCRPLHKAGARLRFVSDGNIALEEISTRPFDLILIDMKMEPDEWGGLWLLRQLHNDGWRIPSLALSGEGAMPQIIEALRLGATDWIQKDKAEAELLERCTEVIIGRLSTSLESSIHRLPAPLAHRFARYAHTTEPDKKVLEGLHALESILRFAAMLGLSSATPAPLRGISLERLAAPSMGTWFTICIALTAFSDVCEEFTQLISWLIPESRDRGLVQELISARNDYAHGRDKPSDIQADHLDLMLRRFAHRATSGWRTDLVVPTSMTYNGAVWTIDLLKLRGIGNPIPDKLKNPSPVITDEALLVRRSGLPLPLSPWVLANISSSGDLVRCLQFDGLERNNGLGPDTPFRYAKTDEIRDVPAVSHPRGVLQALVPWTAS